MKVLVVGGTGVIGAPSVQALVKAGHDVRATARGEKKAQSVRNAGAEPVETDIFDVDALRRAMRGCDAVLRLTTKLAGSLSNMRSKSAWEETNRLRAYGAKCIVDAALLENVGTYVQESFYAVYADAGDRLIDETARVEDGGLATMRAVLESEAQADRFTRTGGCGVSLRFGAFYAADAPSTRETITMVRRRMLPVIDGRFYVDSIHTSDAANAVARALRVPPGVYNITDDEPARFGEMLGSLAQAVAAPAPMHLPGFLGPVLIGYPWRWMSRSLRVSNAKFKAVSGWSPHIRSIVEGWPLVLRELAEEENERFPVPT
ncbi:MAG: NAD-dependent epimerase/dehydratase family protein [Vulcanimicrobiaceae bacterium]